MKLKATKESLRLSFKRFKNFGIGAKVLLIFSLLLFVLEAVIHLFPVYYIIVNAFKLTYNPMETFNVDFSQFTLKHFFNVFTDFTVSGNLKFMGMLFNSLWSTTLRIVVSVISSTMLAYALARFRFPGHNFLFGLVIFIQTVPIMGAGAADFKLRYSLGMVNNPATIWLSWAIGFDYTCFILYGTFLGISRSYSESAELDGASQLQVLCHVVFPMAFPAILAMSITNFTSHWDDYATFQIFLGDYPNLAYGLYSYSTSKAGGFKGKPMYYAALFWSSVPVIIIYACSQSLILKNIAVGGLKG